MSRGRILIVEDERIVAFELERRLERMGFEVVGNFATGEEALASAATRPPELALMDIRLAGPMDGVETARVLRELHGTSVVYLTAYADDATIERLKGTEPLGYVLKPFEQRALHATIETALFRVRAESERAEAERARRRAEARYHSTLDNSPDAIISVDLNGHIVVFNRAAERMFGYAADEVLGATLDLFLPAPLRGRHGKHLSGYAASGGAPRAMADRGPLSAVRKDGSEFPVEVSISSVNEEPLFTAIVRDVSHRQALEAKLRRSQQAEAVGMLAASVIHDVNNLLTVIQQANDLLPRRPIDQPVLLGAISGAVARGTALTRQLLLFARQSENRLGVVGVDAALAGFEHLVRRLIPESVRLVMELGAPGICVALDRHRFEQVILNLVANARDAMPLGGVVTLRTFLVGSVGDGPRELVLEVADTGTGIPDTVMPFIFDLFFSTKSEQRGTGLGLWSAREVVESIGGEIIAKTGVGSGTTFTLRMPCTAESESPSVASKAVSSVGLRVSTNHVTVLIVEDEPSLRQILARTLELHGFKVLTAGGAGEALAILERDADPIDVLVTDLVLPVMGGVELAARMRRFMPRLHVVFMSGHGGEAGAEDAHSRMLEKPFTGDELVAAIDALIVTVGEAC